ncbi:MAG: hypothetical protein EA001_11605 [Oscillatoriales cyanobacterium]|nr:MAG: hypothetical protein EA001_11605 [Oscillatoriales cyanobacterium]
MTQQQSVQQRFVRLSTMDARVGRLGAIAFGLMLAASSVQAQLPNNGPTSRPADGSPAAAGDRQPPISLVVENRSQATFIRRFVIKLRRNDPGSDLLANAIGIYPGESRLLVGDYPREFFVCVEVVPLVPVSGDNSQISHVSLGRATISGSSTRARFGIVNEWNSRRFDRGPCP